MGSGFTRRDFLARTGGVAAAFAGAGAAGLILQGEAGGKEEAPGIFRQKTSSSKSDQTLLAFAFFL